MPIAQAEQPEDPIAEEQPLAPPTPPASENTAESGAGKGRSAKSENTAEAGAGKGRGAKKEKPTPTENEGDDEDEGDDSGAPDNSNIFFQYASQALSPAAKRELSRVAATLKRNKSARVTLSGHTCDKSSSAVNMRLSQKRAEAAAAYLQQLGVSARRISVEAYGYSQPLVPNTSERNRAKNRRVEISVEE